LPGWQHLYPRLANKINFLSIAIDAQGPDVVKPWVELAQATFTTLVDQQNALPDSIGFNAVPTLLLFNADRRLVFGPISFDIRREGMAEAILAWATGQGISGALAKERMGQANPGEAAALFREGQTLFEQGDQAGALQRWRQARDLAPQNWLIRKQIWAVEHPDRFYDGPVDFDWQREQLTQEPPI
jgi:hypothetical protein